ncbi:MAG: T9SS type A sorting domain-containing protein, partial [Phycisphaerae bacterium]|nr:T9SS type A sorting domain-containing protein [Saprospiraceae bacterium]
LSDNIRIEFSATDVPEGNWLESALDIFKVTPSTVGVQPDLDDSATLFVSPNPSASDFSIQFSWENADENPLLEVRNLLGQVVFSEKLASKTGILNLGNHWDAGVYFANLRSAGQSSAAVKLVKQ